MPDLARLLVTTALLASGLVGSVPSLARETSAPPPTDSSGHAVEVTPTGEETGEAVRPWPGLDPGPYPVGYRTLDLVDHARTTAPLLSWTGEPHRGDNFRGVRVSLWYPATVEPQRSPMRYREYLEAAGFETLLEGRLVRGAEAWIGHSLFGGADETRLRALLDEPTTAHRDVPPLAGSFPAIVYAPSFSYEPFENSALFEYLASHGYAIAASRSSGPETREMSYDQAGLEASVRDLELLLQGLHAFGHADLRRLGAAGFSWGGLSAPLLAMRNFNVRAVLALDGSLEHAELEGISERWDWDPRRLRGGYLAMVGDRVPARSLAGEALYADLVELRHPQLEHWDFASDLIRINVWSAGEQNPERRRLVDRAYAGVARQARRLFDAYLKDDETARAVFLATAGGREVDGDLESELLTARPALPPPPSAAELAELLRTDVARGRLALAAAEANDPELQLLDWSRLQDVVTVSPFETKLELLALAREELGESSIYYNNLGQAWRLHGDPEKALAYFRQALEHNPESGFAQRSISELERELGR